MTVKVDSKNGLRAEACSANSHKVAIILSQSCTPKELQHARASLVEKELRNELQKFYYSTSDKEVVV